MTSRPPGYPAMELISAGLAAMHFPLLAYVSASAVASAVAVVAFADLLQSLKTKNWVLVSAGLATTSVFFVQSTTFMDYVWSLAAFAVSLALLARCRFIAAGSAFGLAIAFRPAIFVMVVMVITILLSGRRRSASLIKFGIPMVVVSVAFFSLPLLNFGWAIVRAGGGSTSLREAVARSTVDVWGTLGAIAVALALTGALWRFAAARRLPDGVQRPWALATVVGIVLQFALFLALPEDSGYLIPGVLLLWLLMAMTIPNLVLALVAAAVAVSCFVVPTRTSSLGAVLADGQFRRADVQCALSLLRAAEGLPPGTFVVTGGFMYQLLAHQPQVEFAGVAPTDSFRSDVVPGEAKLSGGQVLTYEFSPEVESTSPRAYRLNGAHADLPVLPAYPEHVQRKLLRPECS